MRQSENRMRRDILLAMKTMLSRKRFEEITVADICKEAMIHRSSFYRYFRDKYEVVDELFMTLIRQLLADTKTSTDAIEQIKAFMHENLTLLHNLSPQNQGRINLYPDTMHLIQDLLAESLHMTEAAGTTDQDPLLHQIKIADDPEMALAFYSGGIMGLFENYDIFDHPDRIDKLLNHWKEKRLSALVENDQPK